MFFKRKSRSSINKTKRPAARVVTTSSWLPASQLELGMYVNELDKPWEQTSFMFQGFVIDSYETLKAVKSACQYASVHTQKAAISSSRIA